MEYLIGLALSLAVAGAAAAIGFDRERAFYPTLLIVIASYYVLFAVMGASGRLVIEIVVASAFLLFAVLVQKKSLVSRRCHSRAWTLDFVHRTLIENPEYRIGGPASVWHSMSF
jgi:hypothetical protein